MAPEIGVIKTNPEPYKALQAVSVAKELLRCAEEYIAAEKYGEAYSNALNAMRFASSALMFFDGCIIQSLEDAVAYIKRNYPTLPVEEWKKAEYRDPSKKGLVESLSELFNPAKKDEKKETAETVSIAKVFVVSVESAIAYGRAVMLERTEKIE
ncbi:MAG: hypothetical protein QXT05_00270 [Candidatus Bilamarchaeaceae archaeon]